MSKAAEKADDDSVIDDIISKENEKQSLKEPTISEEEQRAIRNKKSILGMNVVKPSANRTFISNPRVDPINTKLSQTGATEQHEAAKPSKSNHLADNGKNENMSFQDLPEREIKLANIISQKKRDE